ncbi:hypothetical protein CEXT_495181 [Caerostris extrusa]|uniref:Uncharacterized protein n=1 Tax=Caerostris extrusa TaxID=172846 RepID=A0AAV4WR34_CAEEX|nr:hypothetical protein CEXT_495181 [Caerostris extrusa]
MTLCNGNSSRLQTRLTNKKVSFCSGPRGNYWLHLLPLQFSVGWWSFAFHVERKLYFELLSKYFSENLGASLQEMCDNPPHSSRQSTAEEEFPIDLSAQKDNECSEPAVEKYRMQSAKPIICLPAQIYK